MKIVRGQNKHSAEFLTSYDAILLYDTQFFRKAHSCYLQASEILTLFLFSKQAAPLFFP